MAPKRRQIWTIGHSTRAIGELIALLQENRIELVADVRRFPGSRRHPQFGQTEIAKTLSQHGIEYVHVPELGGRRATRPDSPNIVWRNVAFRGYADYMGTAGFAGGIQKLIESASAKRVAIMCAEALWWRCHRRLIADYLKTAGWTVRHILGPQKVEAHPFTGPARVTNGALSYRHAEAEPEVPLR